MVTSDNVTFHRVTNASDPKTPASSPIENVSVAPAVESETTLPDLTSYSDTMAAQLTENNSVTVSNDLPVNAGEFDFPPLSSDDEPAPEYADVDAMVVASETQEPNLTEEEDDAVSALLTLSQSIPSEASNDGLDNSELIPIGKKMVDAVPVPIRLGKDDVNLAIAKHTAQDKGEMSDTVGTSRPVPLTDDLNAQGQSKNTSSPTPQPGTLSKNTKPMNLPKSPKATNSDDSPTSSHGKL